MYLIEMGSLTRKHVQWLNIPFLIPSSAAQSIESEHSNIFSNISQVPGFRIIH